MHFCSDFTISSVYGESCADNILVRHVPETSATVTWYHQVFTLFLFMHEYLIIHGIDNG